MDYASVETALRQAGLVARGAFHPRPEDRVPPLPGDAEVRTLVLAGNVGPAMWQAFSDSAEGQAGGPDSLDRWTERTLNDLAARFGGRALFPFGGPPYLPFVAWAKRAEPVAESPLGMLIHPDYGLWHAYRGALAFAAAFAVPARADRARPCDACLEKPCLAACPVKAFTGTGYDVPACLAHIESPAGADCMELGCRARRACPVGRSYRQEPAQAGFHMDAFRRANRAGAEGT